MDRKLARHGHGLDEEAALSAIDTGQGRLSSGLERAPGHLLAKPLEGPIENIALGEAAMHTIGGVDDERVGFAEGEQTQGVVEVAVGEDDGVDGRVPGLARVKTGEALDLVTDLRRGIQQEPALAVGADGHAFLGAGGGHDETRADAPAVRAATVPLGKATARRGAQHSDAHDRPPETPQPPARTWPGGGLSALIGRLNRP